MGIYLRAKTFDIDGDRYVCFKLSFNTKNSKNKQIKRNQHLPTYPIVKPGTVHNSTVDKGTVELVMCWPRTSQLYEPAL